MDLVIDNITNDIIIVYKTKDAKSLNELVKYYPYYSNRVKSNRDASKMLLLVNNSLIKKYAKNPRSFKLVTMEQTGGAMINNIPIFAASGLVTVLLAVGAYYTYKYFFRSRGRRAVGSICATDYPLMAEEDVPSIRMLLANLVPKAILPKELSDSSFFETLNHLREITHVIAGISTGAIRYIVQIVKIRAGVIATVASAGMGADTIVDLLALVASVLGTVNVVIQVVQGLTDTSTIRFLTDFFSIDFADGPQGVECWVKHMLKLYEDNSFVFITMCSIFDQLLSIIASLVGNVISTFIPDDGGIIGTAVTEVIIGAQVIGYDVVIGKLSKYYKKIPRKMRKILQDRKTLEEFLGGILVEIENFVNEVIARVDEMGLLGLNTINEHASELIAYFPIEADVGELKQFLSMDKRREIQFFFDSMHHLLPLISTLSNKSLALTFGLLIMLKECE